MPINAVIFDLDGVLVSTDRYHYLAWKAVADRLGLAFNEDLNQHLRGVSRMESLQVILDANGVQMLPEKAEQYAAEKNEMYRSYLRCMTPADVPGEVRGTLAALRRRKLKTAVGSSSKNAGLILELTGLTKEFDAVVDGNDITRSKPDPEVFLLAARRLGEMSERCLVVEDAQAGIEAAVTGGFPSAAIGDAVRHAGVTFRLRHLKELTQILQKM